MAGYVYGLGSYIKSWTPWGASSPPPPLEKDASSSLERESAVSRRKPLIQIEALLEQKLNKPQLRLTSEERIALLLHCISLGKQQVLKAQGKELLVLLGNTGAGKSTLANYLCGCTMQRVSPHTIGSMALEDVITVKPISEGGTKEEILKIGHTSMSMTFMPQIALDTTGLACCDCPGFFDNRGIEIKVSNAVNVRSVLNAAQSLKIVLLIDYHSLRTTRAKGLKDLVKIASSLFGSIKNLCHHKDSVLVGVTQVPPSTQPALENIRNWMRAENSLEPDEIDVLRNFADQLFIYDPLDKDLKEAGALKRDELRNAIEHLTPIRSVTDMFKTVLTSEDLQELEKLADEMKGTMLRLLKQKPLQVDDFKEIASLEEGLQSLKIIEHPYVLRLLDESQKMIADFFKELMQQFELQCIHSTQAASDESEKLLKGIKEGLQFFDRQLQSSLNFPQLEQRYRQELQKRAARLQVTELKKIEGDFFRCCYESSDFTRAETLLGQIRAGLDLFKSQFTLTGETHGIQLLELQRTLETSKGRYREMQQKQAQDQTRLAEAERKLNETTQQMQRQQQALQAVRQIEELVSEFYGYDDEGEVGAQGKCLGRIEAALQDFQQRFAGTGVSPNCNINELKKIYKSTRMEIQAERDKEATIARLKQQIEEINEAERDYERTTGRKNSRFFTQRKPLLKRLERLEK